MSENIPQPLAVSVPDAQVLARLIAIYEMKRLREILLASEEILAGSGYGIVEEHIEKGGTGRVRIRIKKTVEVSQA